MTQARQQVQLHNGQQGFRASLSVQTRVLDDKAGLVEYIASDEALDSYQEIIRADGWRFDQFKKNSPFVDTHDYSSVGKQLGKVVSWRVDKRARQLIETVQWAKDVAQNQTAQLGWEMTRLGYLKAVSVGFFPEDYISKWDASDPAKRPVWTQQLKDLGLNENETPVRCIYIKQQQIELSACIIGANPNALQIEKALADGAINKRESHFLKTGVSTPQFQVPFATKSASDRLAALAAKFETQPHVTSQNKNASPSERLAAIAASFENQPNDTMKNNSLVLARAANVPLVTRCEAILAADPIKRKLWRALGNVLGLTSSLWGEAEHEVARALGTGDNSLGQATAIWEPVRGDVYELIYQNGIFRHFAVTPMEAGKTKIALLKAVVNGFWLKPASQGTAITPTTTLDGDSITPEASTLAALVEVSGEALNDGKTTFEAALMAALVQGLYGVLDRTCLQADGTDDTTNGGMTGIFAHGSVTIVTASAGTVSVQTLVPDDFADTIAAVAPTAFSRPCRWFIYSGFLPQLLKIRAGADGGSEPLLKPPQFEGDDWRILGFPVSWTSGAPSTNAAASKIAVFGRCDAYAVGLRQDLEIKSSGDGATFIKNSRQIRGLVRARCEMVDPTSFAILKTGAV